MKNKGNMGVSVVIVLLVIGFLIYMTVSKKDITAKVVNTAPEVEANIKNNKEEDKIMTQTQQIEGVKITILKEGTGEVAKSGDTVAMNYTGHLADGTTFDSNIDPKFGHVQPFIFTIDGNMVIKGWDLGVAGMKVGEKRNLVIQPAFAYGERGAGGVIPPNAVLSFDVELLGIKK